MNEFFTADNLVLGIRILTLIFLAATVVILIMTHRLRKKIDAHTQQLRTDLAANQKGNIP